MRDANEFVRAYYNNNDFPYEFILIGSWAWCARRLTEPIHTHIHKSNVSCVHTPHFTFSCVRNAYVHRLFYHLCYRWRHSICTTRKRNSRSNIQKIKLAQCVVSVWVVFCVCVCVSMYFLLNEGMWRHTHNRLLPHSRRVIALCILRFLECHSHTLYVHSYVKCAHFFAYVRRTRRRTVPTTATTTEKR